jgi:hypothetical protein
MSLVSQHRGGVSLCPRQKLTAGSHKLIYCPTFTFTILGKSLIGTISPQLRTIGSNGYSPMARYDEPRVPASLLPSSVTEIIVAG